MNEKATTERGQTMSKITKATFKSFIRKNEGNLHINLKSAFDGMTDMCEEQKDGFTSATSTENNISNTLGIIGVWIVGGSRNFFNTYDDGEYTGIECYNCCGHFIVAKKA